MKKITTFMATGLVGLLSLSSFVAAETSVKPVRCQATYTVVVTDENGNVMDKATMHGYGNTCAEAMAEAKWRMEPVRDWMVSQH
jgi:hypothetical protein